LVYRKKNFLRWKIFLENGTEKRNDMDSKEKWQEIQ